MGRPRKGTFQRKREGSKQGSLTTKNKWQSSGTYYTDKERLEAYLARTKKGLLSRTAQIAFSLKNPKKPGSNAFERYERYKYSRTIKEALRTGAAVGDLKFDRERGFLKFRETHSPIKSGSSSDYDTVPFVNVVSLGSRCLMAETMRSLGLRRFMSPFDWIYSTLDMVCHCLEDKFERFLAPDELFPAGKAIGHATYSEMMKSREIIFPHHDPRTRHRVQFERAVDRLKCILKSSRRTLFLHCVVTNSEPALSDARAKVSGRKGALKLFRTLLESGATFFELIVVIVVCGKASRQARWGKRRGKKGKQVIHKFSAKACRSILRIRELHCKGACTGLRLKCSDDRHALEQIIQGKRRFNLLPDPLGHNTK